MASPNRNKLTPEQPAKPYIVKNRDPLKLKDFSLRFRDREKLLGIPKGNPGPGPYGGEDYVPYCNADIVAVEAKTNHEPNPKVGVKDAGQAPVVIGHIIAQIVQISRSAEDDMSMWEICDMQSFELSSMFQALYERDGTPKEAHDDELGWGGDVLYIHEVYLKKQYRGYGIGLLAVHGLIHGLPSFYQGTAVLSPLAHSREGVENFDFVTASNKLEKHWELIGFEKWVDSLDHGRIMGLWTGHQKPRIEDVVPHLIRTEICS